MEVAVAFVAVAILVVASASHIPVTVERRLRSCWAPRTLQAFISIRVVGEKNMAHQERLASNEGPGGGRQRHWPRRSEDRDGDRGWGAYEKFERARGRGGRGQLWTTALTVGVTIERTTSGLEKGVSNGV